MPSLLRPANLFILVSYLLLSAVPFAPFLMGQTVSHPGRVIGLEATAWLAVWIIFKRPAWFHWLLIPAFLALPIDLYLQIFYDQGITTHHLGIIAETSPREALEFLGNKIWLVGFIFIGVIVWWWLGWKAACTTRALDLGIKMRVALAILLLSGAGVWFYGDKVGIAPATLASASVHSSASIKQSVASAGSGSTAEDSDDDADDDDQGSSASASIATGIWSKMPKLPAWAHIPFDLDILRDTRPFGLAIVADDFRKERQYLFELAHQNSQFKFGAHQAGNLKKQQIVVMVIGESSRYDRWSLNGYQRETNPLLKNESNLITLSNVVTAVSATRLSVPVLISRKPAIQSLKAGFSEKSFLTAYKEAGFKTYWISNQMTFGQFDTPISVFANEADTTEFLNPGGFTNDSSYDQILLQPLQNAINDPAPKKLIVLHTLGNHWNYSHRYPQEFDKWQPSLFGIVDPAYTELKFKPNLNNSYDNSILYTDWFLSHVINTLKDSHQLASMMYLSDHGETLYDGTCNLAFHGHNTQYEFHIPALVWYSDLYRLNYPDKIAQLARNRRAKLATENVFHSLLDMADIRYGNEHLEWSFLSKKFKQHRRYVDSYGWTDYDNATFKGDCREVIDRGHPLKQEH